MRAALGNSTFVSSFAVFLVQKPDTDSAATPATSLQALAGKARDGGQPFAFLAFPNARRKSQCALWTQRWNSVTDAPFQMKCSCLCKFGCTTRDLVLVGSQGVELPEATACGCLPENGSYPSASALDVCVVSESVLSRLTGRSPPSLRGGGPGGRQTLSLIR